MKLCVHGLDELGDPAARNATLTAKTSTREQLLTALGALEVDALLLDLDQPDATDLIIAALEVRPALVVVGAASQSDLQGIIRAQRAGCSQIIAKPVSAADLTEALLRALPHNEGGAPGQVFALIGAVGGSGVTTLACHLALELCRSTGGKTALIDMDFEFGRIARAFDLAPNMTIADLVAVERIEPDLLTRVAVEVPGGANVIARPNGIGEAHELPEPQVIAVQRTAQQMFPFVVVDLPRKLDGVAGHTIENCTKLLVVVQLSVPSVDNTRRLLDALSHGGVPPERVEIVVNRYRKGAGPFTLDMLEKQLGRKVIGLVPNDFQAVSHAIDTGQTLTERNPVRMAVADLATKLIGSEGAESRSGGWCFVRRKPAPAR